MSSRDSWRCESDSSCCCRIPYNAIPPHLDIGRTIAEPLLIHGGLAARRSTSGYEAPMAEVGLSPDLRDSLSRRPERRPAAARQYRARHGARSRAADPRRDSFGARPGGAGEAADAFRALQVRHGITYIYISHDLSMVRRVCNRIAVMYLGRVVELATNQETFFNSGHPYTRALLSAVPVIEENPIRPRPICSRASLRTRSTSRRVAASEPAVRSPSAAVPPKTRCCCAGAAPISLPAISPTSRRRAKADLCRAFCEDERDGAGRLRERRRRSKLRRIPAMLGHD